MSAIGTQRCASEEAEKLPGARSESQARVVLHPNGLSLEESVQEFEVEHVDRRAQHGIAPS